MTTQEKKLAKKIGRPATGRGQTIGVRLHAPEVESLDQWMAANGHKTRAGAVRAIVQSNLDASAVAGEAYQVIGALADAAGLFDHPEVQRALDYFSKAPDGSLLPFGPLPRARQ